MDRENPNQQIQYRTIEIRKADLKDDRTIELSFSSEEPYVRSWGVEILDHESKSVILDRLNNAAPLLLHHDTFDQIGVVEKAWIDGRRGKAVVRFSRSAKAEEIYQDVMDGIRRNVSVGYMIHKVVLQEENDEKSVYRVTRWEPLEISIVPVPADNTVGVGRSITPKEVKLCSNNLSSSVISSVTSAEPFSRLMATMAAEVFRRLLP